MRRYLALPLLLVACGAGPYGHSRVYSPLGAEEAAVQGAVEYDPVMAKRQPEDWAKKKIMTFGVVLKRDDHERGKAQVVISVRTLEGRNLCEEASEDTCRTTVSDHEFDRIRVNLAFSSPEDDAGEHSVGVGSLVRVVGTIHQGATEGGLTLDASYYRHWPRGFYVLASAAGTMRR